MDAWRYNLWSKQQRYSWIRTVLEELDRTGNVEFDVSLILLTIASVSQRHCVERILIQETFSSLGIFASDAEK